VKVMIAARLLADGTMSGQTEALARSMISRSDDAAANVLWQAAGGPDLEPWIEEHYGLPELGSPNTIPGRWGNTHVTALGLARLYAALRADPVVWPWLGAALHGMQAQALDGTDQVFGLPAVSTTAAVKQGWANGSADDPADAVVNSTGYVAGDRYVVVLLTEGDGNVGGCDSRGFHAGQAATVTAMAGELVPSLIG
jgi:Beta-lactamase enzyme family